MSTAYVTGLIAASGQWARTLTDSAELTDWLVHALMQLGDQSVGLVLSRAAVPLTATDVQYVSQEVLTLLHYPDQASYATAVTVSGFAHADDLAIVEQHIASKSTATYDARLLRGDGPTYRRMRIQGMTFKARDGSEYRVSLLRVAP